MCRTKRLSYSLFPRDSNPMSNHALHPATSDPERLYRQCRVERLRRSGPGGQHRNKVETAIRLVHEPTGVSAEASERRSQEQNRQRALARLRVNLALQVRCSVGEEQSVSELWRSRLQGSRIRVNGEHDDFPAILAEALDRVAAEAFDVKGAAERLGCSTSQLIKLLKVEPQAFTLVNRAREELGLDRLR